MPGVEGRIEVVQQWKLDEADKILNRFILFLLIV